MREVILGFTNNDRNSFPELRRYARHFEETKYLAEMDPSYEHRTKYTYCLGEYEDQGWCVWKRPIKSKSLFILDYAYWAGTPENICIPILPPELMAACDLYPEEKTDSEENFEIVEYSERSIAVFGPTKPISTKMAELKGSYNRNLTYSDGKRKGWIFSKKREAAVRSFLEDYINKIKTH